MSNPTPRKSKTQAKQNHVHFTRGARLGFLFLLFTTVLFAVGALLITYQLDHFKDDVEATLQEKVSENLTIGDVTVNGLRGLTISNLQVSLPFAHGPEVTIDVPEALMNLDIRNLFTGKVTLSQLVLNDANVEIVRPLESDWLTGTSSNTLEWESELSALSGTVPFQISGNNANVTVRNIVNDSQVNLSNIHFEVGRRESIGAQDTFKKNTPKIEAYLSGNLLDNPQKSIIIDAEYASLDDFDVTLTQSLLTAEDVSVIFPADTPHVLSGEISPYIRMYGGSDNVIIVNLEAPINDLLLRDQLETLDATTGELSVWASYDTAVQELEIITAKVESDQIEGSIDGSIYFSQSAPLFDLELLCTQLPIQAVLDSTLEERIAQYGTLELVLSDEQQLSVTVQGTSNNPIINSEITSTGGTLRYTPNNAKFPPVELTLGPISGGWDTLNEEGSGSIDIIDGYIKDESSNIEASNITGTLTLADKKLRIAPFNAMVTDNTLVGSFEYDLTTQDGAMTLEGTVKNLEKTSYRKAIKNLTMGGDLTIIKCEARKKGNEFFLDAEVEASQTKLDYMWFFTKGAGVGAKGTIKGHLIPQKSYRFDFESELASSQLTASLQATYFKSAGKYITMESHLSSSHIDVPTVGAGINMPYRFAGTTGKDAYLHWTRDPNNWDYNTQSYGAHFDEISLLPKDENAKEPIHLKNATITINTQNAESNTGALALNTKELNTPPFTSTWFVAIPPSEEYPPTPRNWTYTINAENMSLPPWKGTQFTSEGYSDPKSSGFKTFTANIDGGTLKGAYDSNRTENSYTSNITWEKVPIHYFLKHMNYDDIMSGTIDGTIRYGIDRDAPNTLKGEGSYTVNKGQFHPRFLQSLLSSDDAESASTLPSTLDFTSLKSDVRLEKDVIFIPNLNLDSTKIKITEGKGQFIREGDLDFTIPVAISPQMAETIPTMARSFNIAGYKTANADIKLVFHITGTTDAPKVEVTELPSPGVAVGVALIGASKEVIDLPRKLLRDLFKMGGGIVGGAKN